MTQDHADDADDVIDPVEYWYNDRTGEVEVGPQSLAVYRIGPFATREEAEHAIETVQGRAEAWNHEDG